MANELERILQNFDRFGLTEYVLPFVLIFTVVFAVLEKTQILGTEKKNLNVGVALIMAAATVIPHATGRWPGRFSPVDIINNALPQVSILVVAVISLMILIGVFAHDRLYLGITAPGWIATFSVVAIVLIFGASAGWWLGGFDTMLVGTFGADAVSVFIMILVFGIIIAYITSGGSHEREKVGALNDLGFNFGKLFNGGGKH